MFFFSYGKFKTLCTPTATATTIISSNILCTGSTTSKVEMGQIDGVLPSTATINDQLPGFTGEFPGDRLLYNVYSDGADPSEPASAPAALNIVSEDGFLCKPSTSADIDPNTGSTYLSEIDSTIKAQGFLALPLEVEDGQGVTANANYNTTHAGIPNPAWTTGGLSASKYAAANETGAPWNFPAANTDTDNSAISGSYSNVLDDGVTGTATATTSAPVGYCLTLTTDGETGGTN